LARSCDLTCTSSSAREGCGFKRINATKREANETNLAVRQIVKCMTAPSEPPTRSIVQFTTILYGCENPTTAAMLRLFRFICGERTTAESSRYQVQSLRFSRADFDRASTAHVLPVVLVFGATTNANLVSTTVGRLAWPQKLVGTAMQ
jgi:hypothetical protein